MVEIVKVLDALNIFSEKKIVENEIIVLRSSSLMEDVVDSLDLYATVFNEGNVQTEELYADNSPIKFIALDKTILLVPENISSILNGQRIGKDQSLFLSVEFLRFNNNTGDRSTRIITAM